MAQIAANLQRIKNGQRRYAITPRVPAGFIQPEQLQKYIDVANEFGAVLKLTGSQRIMITNLKAEDVDKAWEMLGMEPAYTVSNRVRSVKIRHRRNGILKTRSMMTSKECILSGCA